MARAKITGFIEVEDHQLDPTHVSGLTEDAYLELAEDYLGIDDLDIKVED